MIFSFTISFSAFFLCDPLRPLRFKILIRTQGALAEKPMKKIFTAEDTEDRRGRVFALEKKLSMFVFIENLCAAKRNRTFATQIKNGKPPTRKVIVFPGFDF